MSVQMETLAQNLLKNCVWMHYSRVRLCVGLASMKIQEFGSLEYNINRHAGWNRTNSAQDGISFKPWNWTSFYQLKLKLNTTPICSCFLLIFLYEQAIGSSTVWFIWFQWCVHLKSLEIAYGKQMPHFDGNVELCDAHVLTKYLAKSHRNIRSSFHVLVKINNYWNRLQCNS